MATQAVRFEFHCMETDGKLRVVHEIPRSLLNVDTRLAQSDAEYQQRFADALRPIFKEHEPACKAMSGPSCANCGSPTVKALQTTQSWLHRPGDPMVLVWVYPAGVRGARPWLIVGKTTRRRIGRHTRRTALPGQMSTANLLGWLRPRTTP
ncbi:hypothetical protein EDB80DRAFT_730940 [Ilyonectria destructans]|nr:hypothetical protein EDB80DRAFT_730940 [Ilyonectria destructans]